MSGSISDQKKGPSDGSQAAALQAVADALARLKYGAIQLTVHEGRLVQIDVTERQRFSS